MAETDRAEFTSAEIQEDKIDPLRRQVTLAKKQLMTVLIVVLVFNICLLVAMVVFYFTRLRTEGEAHMIQRSPEFLDS